MYGHIKKWKEQQNGRVYTDHAGPVDAVEGGYPPETDRNGREFCLHRVPAETDQGFRDVWRGGGYFRICGAGVWAGEKYNVKVHRNNERYSEGGNSLYLREEFRNFSSSKLAEMLTLPDAECQLITDKTTVKEIRELKSFSRQQAEEAGPETDAGHTPLEKCIIDFFSQKQEALNMVMGYLSADEPGYREAEGIINPSGQGSHRKGIVFLFFMTGQQVSSINC